MQDDGAPLQLRCDQLVPPAVRQEVLDVLVADLHEVGVPEHVVVGHGCHGGGTTTQRRQPRDHLGRQAKYLLWDPAADRIEVRALDYDVHTTIRLLHEHGFPAVNARRLGG